MKHETNFFKQNTKIKNFIPLPRFILKEDISSSAKIIYGLLIARTMVSQKEENADKWSDTLGNIYIMYTIQNLAKDAGMSTGTVKNALEQLRLIGLIQTIWNGNNKPNTIFVKFPEGAFKESEADESEDFSIKITHSEGRPLTRDDFEDAGRSMDGHQNLSHREDKIYPSGRTEYSSPDSHNVTPIYTDTFKQKNYTYSSEMQSDLTNKEGLARIRAIAKATADRLPKA